MRRCVRQVDLLGMIKNSRSCASPSVLLIVLVSTVPRSDLRGEKKTLLLGAVDTNVGGGGLTWEQTRETRHVGKAEGDG